VVELKQRRLFFQRYELCAAYLFQGCCESSFSNVTIYCEAELDVTMILKKNLRYSKVVVAKLGVLNHNIKGPDQNRYVEGLEIYTSNASFGSTAAKLLPLSRPKSRRFSYRKAPCSMSLPF